MKQIIIAVVSGFVGGAAMVAINDLTKLKDQRKFEAGQSATNSVPPLVLWKDGNVTYNPKRPWGQDLVHVRNWDIGAREDGVVVWKPTR